MFLFNILKTEMGSKWRLEVKAWGPGFNSLKQKKAGGGLVFFLLESYTWLCSGHTPGSALRESVLVGLEDILGAGEWSWTDYVQGKQPPAILSL